MAVIGGDDDQGFAEIDLADGLSYGIGQRDRVFQSPIGVTVMMSVIDAAVEAARLGAVIHGEAADLAAADGERGMLATDLLPFIRRLVNPDNITS